MTRELQIRKFVLLKESHDYVAQFVRMEIYDSRSLSKETKFK